MRSQRQLRADFRSALSEELDQMAENESIDQWVNDARVRLGYYVGNTAPVTWAAQQALVDLPADFCEFDSLVPPTGYRVPAFRIWKRKIRFDELPTAAGTATLYYSGEPPAITADAASVLPDVLDQAMVSLALSRFYRWLAGSRADYRRYSTLAQGNAADIPQLLAAAAAHRADATEAMAAHPNLAPVSFFGE